METSTCMNKRFKEAWYLYADINLNKRLPLKYNINPKVAFGSLAEWRHVVPRYVPVDFMYVDGG